MAKTAAEVYEERGRREGRIEGRRVGKIEGRRVGEFEGQRRTLLYQMRRKFGALPDAVVTKVEAIQSVAELDRPSERILMASSLEEMGLTEA